MPGTGDILAERYRLERVIGRGGTSTVFLAHDLEADTVVAVKEICLEASSPTRREALLKQFQLEADILSSLQHPSLPTVHDFYVQSGGFCYLVMDYIEGTTLLETIREKGPADEESVLQWAGQIAGALSYLHSRTPPVVLRDLKPSNLMLTESGRIMVIDFGIAKLHDPEQGMATQTSARGMLTPGFASPEHYSGGTDTSSDLYSLGATLYYLLTSQVPPESVELLTGERELAPLSQARPDVSPALEDLISRLLLLRRGERPTSADLVRRELLNLGDDSQDTSFRPIQSAAPSPSPALAPARGRRFKFPWRRWRSTLLLIVAIAGILPSLPQPWSTRVLIESDPPNAMVFADGSQVGMTPLEASLPRGNVMIHVSSSGRMPVSEIVELTAGSNEFEAHLLKPQLSGDDERAALKELQKPPGPFGIGKLLPDYYPPSRQSPPWSPKVSEHRKLGLLKYSLPAGWTVESDEPEEVVMSAEGRTWTLRTVAGANLLKSLETESARLNQDGYQVISQFHNESKGSIRYQKDSLRGYLLLGKQGEAIISSRLECDPCPKAAFLIQSSDILRGHIEGYDDLFF